MAVLHDYRCKSHGLYEAYAPKCPYGCSARFQSLEFNQAPSYHNGRTANTDRNLRGLAEQAGLTDMKNDPKSGESVMAGVRRGNFAAQWGGVPEGKVSAADYGVQGDAQITPGMFGKGIPTQVRRDPRGMSDLT
jgi:hypothetical protein